MVEGWGCCAPHPSRPTAPRHPPCPPRLMLPRGVGRCAPRRPHQAAAAATVSIAEESVRAQLRQRQGRPLQKERGGGGGRRRWRCRWGHPGTGVPKCAGGGLGWSPHCLTRHRRLLAVGSCEATAVSAALPGPLPGHHELAAGRCSSLPAADDSPANGQFFLPPSPPYPPPSRWRLLGKHVAHLPARRQHQLCPTHQPGGGVATVCSHHRHDGACPLLVNGAQRRTLRGSSQSTQLCHAHTDHCAPTRASD